MKKELIDSATPTGKVRIQHLDADGNLKGEHYVNNLVVTTGKNYIASKMVATTNSPVSMTHMAIGTGTTTPAAGDTALGTQTGRVTLAGSSVASNAITYTATFPAGTGSGAITEAGIFNASSGGTMLCRTTFPVVNKASGDSIAITWIVTVS
jgi:hypothetical protein